MQNLLFFSVLSVFVFVSSGLRAQEEYRRAVETKDNVKNKLFPKSGKFELNVPDLGMVINQALVNTLLLRVGANYYPSEEWGYGAEFFMVMPSAKEERECLETFYNDPLNQVDAECAVNGSQDQVDPSGAKSNVGPAYMPTRFIKMMVGANVMWHPIYGKQILMSSGTSYFDLFVTMGLGLALSEYNPQATELSNGQRSRPAYDRETGRLLGGAPLSQNNLYGEEGRPEAESQTTPMINLGIGQRFHFMKSFSFRFEFRNMLLVGTPDGFENLFAVWGGLGMRF